MFYVFIIWGCARSWLLGGLCLVLVRVGLLSVRMLLIAAARGRHGSVPSLEGRAQ